MYCSGCGTPVTSNLSFCNRCGTSLKERGETKEKGIVTGLISALVLVGIFGLAIMFAGAIALKKGGDLNMDVVGMFMFFTFVIVGMIEFCLLRQISKVIAGGSVKTLEHTPPLF